MPRVSHALSALLALAACRTTSPLPPLAPGTWLAGTPEGLEEAAVLDARDFAYSAAFSPDGLQVGFSHLAADGYRLGLVSLATPAVRRHDVRVNRVEDDVEALAFSPDGRQVATAGRDGRVRLWEAQSGALLGTVQTEEGLVSLAFHPSGGWLAAGGEAGRVLAFRVPGLLPLGGVAAHTGEVRALAFRPDGTLVSGGWDKQVALWEVRQAEAPLPRVRMRPLRQEGLTLLRPGVGEGTVVAMALDARLPFVALTPAAAQAAGLTGAQLSETVEVPTALGQARVPLARAVPLRFQQWVLPFDVVVCGACVPAGAQGVLGAPFRERVQVLLEEASGLLELSLPGGSVAPTVPHVLFTQRVRHTFASHVNDVALDAAGQRMALALSEAPARRTPEVYRREKAGVVEPLAQGNAGLLVEVESGRVLAREGGHHGVVATAAVSPDGRTLVTGGWDRTLRLTPAGASQALAVRRFGWSVRRVRFSPDGQHLVVAAWTPQNPLGDQRTAPSVVLYRVLYRDAQVRTSTR